MFLYLTTTGRRTGLPREIEIWFTERGGHFYVIAEHREGKLNRATWETIAAAQQLAAIKQVAELLQADQQRILSELLNLLRDAGVALCGVPLNVTAPGSKTEVGVGTCGT